MDCLHVAAVSEEEKLQATPSELQRAEEDDPTIVTVKDHQKQYRYLNQKPNLPRDIIDPHSPRSFPCWVFIWVERILAANENETVPFVPLCLSATSTKGVPATEWPQDFTFPARLWDMPSATTIKLLGAKMVWNLLSPIVVRDGTPLGDVADESQTVFGQLPADEANCATRFVTHLLTRLDAKIAQVQSPSRWGCEAMS